MLTFDAKFMLNRLMAAREPLWMVPEIETFSGRLSLIMCNSEQSGDLDYRWRDVMFKNRSNSWQEPPSTPNEQFKQNHSSEFSYIGKLNTAIK
jgi:hypothetical protein